MLYKLGRSAHNAVASARRTFADGIRAIPAEIFFTSGGTESDSWAIKGTAHRLARLGKRHIVTDNIEHHAVLNSVSALAREGFEITYVKADADGVVPPQAIRAAIRPDTALVSVMFANNELGTIQPVAEIGRICRGAGVLFHCDTVQAAGIMAAKHTPDIIPMCHPILIDGIDIRLTLNEASCCVDIVAEVSCTGHTGVEMEALTAASAAALTVYDMCKAVQKDIVISDIRLLKKTGGVHGDFTAE